MVVAALAEAAVTADIAMHANPLPAPQSSRLAPMAASVAVTTSGLPMASNAAMTGSVPPMASAMVRVATAPLAKMASGTRNGPAHIPLIVRKALAASGRSRAAVAAARAASSGPRADALCNVGIRLPGPGSMVSISKTGGRIPIFEYACSRVRAYARV